MSQSEDLQLDYQTYQHYQQTTMKAGASTHKADRAKARLLEAQGNMHSLQNSLQS